MGKTRLHLSLGLPGLVPVKALTLSLLLLSAPAWGGEPFGRDKGMHFAVGLSIGAGTHAIASGWFPRANPWVVSVSFGVALGGGKELADGLLGLGTPSVWDFLWTLAGDLAGSALSAGAQWVLAGR